MSVDVWRFLTDKSAIKSCEIQISAHTNEFSRKFGVSVCVITSNEMDVFKHK